MRRSLASSWASSAVNASSFSTASGASRLSRSMLAWRDGARRDDDEPCGGMRSLGMESMGDRLGEPFGSMVGPVGNQNANPNPVPNPNPIPNPNPVLKP
mmetsp:Transcript_18210/g.55648  ORF Transcript_18210/g.55648 Transcript_18210/m.55648 type:complete len:99 (-) Transcript_18210:12-308(-)